VAPFFEAGESRGTAPLLVGACVERTRETAQLGKVESDGRITVPINLPPQPIEYQLQEFELTQEKVEQLMSRMPEIDWNWKL
jgi:hypothetical protein